MVLLGSTSTRGSKDRQSTEEVKPAWYKLYLMVSFGKLDKERDWIKSSFLMFGALNPLD